MTNTDWRTLPAGRELDALVHRDVMGHAVCDKPSGCMLPESCSLYGTDHLAPDDPTIPAYSEDIAAAWSLVERLIADGWFPEVQFNNWGAKSWNANAMRSTDDPKWRASVDGTADTAPLAICRAALAATEAP